MVNQQRVLLFSLISGDVSDRLAPICRYLKNHFVTVELVLICKDPLASAGSEMVSTIKLQGVGVVLIRSVQQGILQQRNFENDTVIYLVRHSQLSSGLISLVYLYLRSRSESKFIAMSHLPYIEELMSGGLNKNQRYMAIKTASLNTLKYGLLAVGGHAAYLIYLIMRLIYRRQRIIDSKLYSHPSSILFIRLDHLGDMVCTLPSLQALRRTYPISKITVLCTPSGASLLEEVPHLYDELITWEAPWCDRNKGYLRGKLSIFSFMKFVNEARRNTFDLIIQSRGEEVNVLMALLLRSKKLVSGSNTNHPLLFKMMRNVEVPVLYDRNTTYHISEWPRLCLNAVGIEVTEGDIRESLRLPSLPDALEDQITKARNDGKAVIAIMIGAGHAIRQWSVGKFVELIEKLYEKNVVVILVGGAAEMAIRDEIVGSCSVPLVDTVGRLGLLKLASLFKACDFVISHDTSMMHLASLVGKRVIAIFGPGNLGVAKPVFSENQVIKKELGCSGCSDKCAYLNQRVAPCIEKIAVDDVYRCVEDYLEVVRVGY